MADRDFPDAQTLHLISVLHVVVNAPSVDQELTCCFKGKNSLIVGYSYSLKV